MLSLAFLYPLIFFVQPGVLWPELAPYLPLQVVSGLVLLTHAFKRGDYTRAVGFGHPAFKWMVAYMCVQSVSVIREGMASVVSEAAYVAPIAEFVALSLLLVDSPRSFRRYVWGMVCGSMWLVAYGIYAYYHGMREDYGGLAGAYGNYENHNDYSFVIIQVLPFVYMLRRDATRWVVRLMLAAALAACLLGTLASMSRGGMIALVFEIALIVLLTMPPRRRLLLLPLVLAVGMAGIGYQYARRAAINGDNYTAEDAEDSRIELWKAGKNMFLAHPIIGVGNRRFAELGQEYGELSHDQVGKNAHNTYIETAATTGLLGVIAFGAMLLAVRRETRLTMPASPGPDPAGVDALRLALRIALLSMLLRAFFDAKGHDWSFYLFVVLAAVLREHRQRYDARAASTEAATASLPTGAPLLPPHAP